MRDVLFRAAVCFLLASSIATDASARERWSVEQARAWSQAQPWLVGANYTPAYAINQLEMWQGETFDPAAIDRELGWAEELGFTSLRVFLHHLLWEQDADGFLHRLDQFLEIADRHRIGVMFVLFDSVWDPHPRLGRQRAPQPGLHNSGWVQSPGADDLIDSSRHRLLEEYVRGVIGHFKNDRRVQVWDIWNEPDNTNDNSYGKDKLNQEPSDKVSRTLPLLARSFTWARAADPLQPITSGVWRGTWRDPDGVSPTERIQLEESDVISFHTYAPPDEAQHAMRNLQRYERRMALSFWQVP